MYRGPGAAANGQFHHYVFELDALDTKLELKPSGDAFETGAKVMKVIQGHILAKAGYGGPIPTAAVVTGQSETQFFALLDVVPETRNQRALLPP